MLPASQVRIGDTVAPEFAACGCGQRCGRCTANYGQGPARVEPSSGELRSLGATTPALGVLDALELGELAPRRLSSRAVLEPRGVEADAGPEPWERDTSRLGEFISLVELASLSLGLPPVNIDIYFSAGPRGGANPFGCSMRIATDGSATAVCSLYRVRIRFGTFSPFGTGTASVWRIKHASTGNRDRFQPDILDEGTRTTLAYTLRLHDDGKKHAIVAKDLTSPGRPFTRVTESEGRGGLQFPAFTNTRFLTWSALTNRGGGGASSDLWGIQGTQVGPGGGGMTHVSPPQNLLGDFDVSGPTVETDSRQDLSGGSAEDADFEDADRRPRGLPYRGKRVVTMHSKARTGTTAIGRPVPIVSELSSKSGAPLEYEAFMLGINPDGFTISECHHPSWGPLDDIMCHDHQGYVRDAVRIRPLLAYEQTGTQPEWGPGGSATAGTPSVDAFVMPTVADLESQFATELAVAGMPTGGIGLVSFKYAKFTDDPDLIVATLMISDTLGFADATSGFSRVVLIRRSDGRIWDLTRLVEAFESLGRGSMGAWAPTSASPAFP
jgi:hypothetical protein